MTFNIFKYQIKNYQYGWMTQKRVGSQWKDSSFFRTLGSAANYIFEQQLANVTKCDAIDLANVQQTKQQIDRVIERMDSIRDEITRVLHG